MADGTPETCLERLWAGGFGDDYLERNAAAHLGRKSFWGERLAALQPREVLEVGCSAGGNLRWIAEAIGDERVTGIDVNERALELLRERLPRVNAQRAQARKLPFDDASFDLVFTMGVLIHQPPDEVEDVMREIVRCSRRYVLSGEYHDEDEIEVPYRGERGALFRRDYGALYRKVGPELRLVEEGFLPKSAGSAWDDVTWWVFEKPSSQ